VESYLSGEKTFVIILGKSFNCRFCRQFVVLIDNFSGKYFAGYAILYHHLKCSFNFSRTKVSFERHSPSRSTRSHAHPGSKSVKVIVFFTGVKSALLRCLFSWKIPAFADGRAEHLPGQLAGKRGMAGVGLADSFNMVIMSFFAAIDLGTTVVVAFSLGKRDRRRARSGASRWRYDAVLVLLAAVIHAFGKEIINFVAGDATRRSRTWR
jgi:hypothetical protein